MNKKFGEELIDLIFGTISVFKKGGIGKNSRTPTGVKMSDIPYLSRDRLKFTISDANAVDVADPRVSRTLMNGADGAKVFAH